MAEHGTHSRYTDRKDPCRCQERRYASAAFGLGYIRSTSSGASSLFYIADTASVPALPGETGTASVYLRANVARSTILTLRYYTSGGATSGTFVSAASKTSTSAWVSYTVTGLAPATTASLAVFVTSTGSVSGNFTYADNALLTKTSTVLPYFDGDNADDANHVFEWTGSPANSISIRRTYTLLTQRILEIVADHANPEVTISGLRWNAQEDPTLAASLDVQDRVRVEFKGVSQDSRIIGIKHTSDRSAA